MLLYASHSDQEAVDMIDRDEHKLKEIYHAMQTIEHITSIAKTKEDIIRMFQAIWRTSDGVKKPIPHTKSLLKNCGLRRSIIL